MLAQYKPSKSLKTDFLIRHRCLNIDTIDRDMLLLIDPSSNHTSNPSSFHFDSNVFEVCKATICLEQLFQRASSILIDIPGNEILTCICQLCYKIADFHANASIGRMLTSLQILLIKCQEWTQYAARHVSLQDQMESIRKLISTWRQLELKSWEDLLRSKECIYAKRAFHHWFSLFEIVKGNFNFLSNDSMQETNNWSTLMKDASPWLLKSFKTLVISLSEKQISFIQSVFDTIDAFLRNSIVGEFPMRLHLVRLFALEMQQDILSNHITSLHKELYRHLANVLTGLWSYYHQFLPHTRSFQDSLKSLIQEKVTGTIKISKWDHLNTYSLLGHSDKIHRSLNKLIREYQSDVLEYPMSALLKKSLLGGLVSDVGELIPVDTVPVDNDLFPLFKDEKQSSTQTTEQPSDGSGLIIPSTAQMRAIIESLSRYTLVDRLLNVEILLSKFSKYAVETFTYSSDSNNSLSVRYGRLVAESAELLCLDIFDRISSLRESTATNSIKYRAISDLYKTLREEGVSHLRSDAPSELKHMLLILGTPSLLVCETLGRIDTLINKGEMYFIRNITELNQMYTQILSPISKDVTIRDVQLMLGLTENMMSIGLQTRCALTCAINTYKRAFDCHHQLDALVSINVAKPGSLLTLMHEALEYSISVGNAIIGGIVDLKLLVSTLRESYASQNFEDHSIVPHIDNKQFDVGLSFLDTLIRGVESLRANEVKTCDYIIGYTLSLKCLPTNDWWQQCIHTCKQLQIALISSSASIVCDLVSKDVAFPVTNALSVYIDRLLLYAIDVTTIHNDSSVSSHGLDNQVCSIAVNCIESCLVAMQNIRKEECKITQDSTLIDASKKTIELFGALQLEVITYHYENLLTTVSTSEYATSIEVAKLTLPFFISVLRMYNTAIDDAFDGYKSTGKLTYVCLRVFRNLLAKGLCSASSEEGEGGDGSGDRTFEDDVDGTGMFSIL